ncbi:MAG: DUF86 domain-containing protein [Deltaproteobacteria bacterium]|jgi:uncharacterized protein YutE (UPF0331/DUF86 family)|nr:DUF86 domain-containing protein [Deltaproteobacteria bacterium]
MKLDQELVLSRCQEIADSLNRLAQIGNEPKETFLQDQDLQDIGCYRLLVAIEAALALCYHIAAKMLSKVPEDYAGCFSMLGESEIISRDLSERLQKMARFRNLLVHMYWKIDYEAVYDIIGDSVNDLRDFSCEVMTLV